MRGLGLRVKNHLPRGTWPAQNVKSENVQAMGGRKTGRKLALCQPPGVGIGCADGAVFSAKPVHWPNPMAQHW